MQTSQSEKGADEKDSQMTSRPEMRRERGRDTQALRSWEENLQSHLQAIADHTHGMMPQFYYQSPLIAQEEPRMASQVCTLPVTSLSPSQLKVGENAPMAKEMRSGPQGEALKNADPKSLASQNPSIHEYSMSAAAFQEVPENSGYLNSITGPEGKVTDRQVRAGPRGELTPEQEIRTQSSAMDPIARLDTFQPVGAVADEYLLRFVNSSCTVGDKIFYLQTALKSLEIDDSGSSFSKLINRHVLLRDQYDILERNAVAALQKLAIDVNDPDGLVKEKQAKAFIVIEVHKRDRFLELFAPEDTNEIPSSFPLAYIKVLPWKKSPGDQSMEHLQIHPCLRSLSLMSFYSSPVKSTAVCFYRGHVVCQAAEGLQVRRGDREMTLKNKHHFEHLCVYQGGVFGVTRNGIYFLGDPTSGKINPVQVYYQPYYWYLFIQGDSFFYYRNQKLLSVPVKYEGLLQGGEYPVHFEPEYYSAEFRLKSRRGEAALLPHVFVQEALQEGSNLAAFHAATDGELLAYMTKTGYLCMPMRKIKMPFEQEVLNMTVGSNGEVAMVYKVANGYMLQAYH